MQDDVHRSSVQRLASEPPLTDHEKKNLREMLDEYVRYRANKRAFIKGLVIFGGIAGALTLIQNWIVSVWDLMVAAIRGGH